MALKEATFLCVLERLAWKNSGVGFLKPEIFDVISTLWPTNEKNGMGQQ